PGAALRCFHVLARVEQVGAGLLARLAFEALRATLDVALARGQLRAARVELLRVAARALLARGELLLLGVELPRPGLDGGEQGVQRPLGPRHDPLGDLQYVRRDPEAAR